MNRDSTNMSLAMSISLESALVTAVAMAVYAVFQYISMPGYTVLGLFIEHGWHVLVLGVLIYGAMYCVLRKHILRPINAIYVKCYAITKGDCTPLEIDSRIEEIQAIVDGINMMQERLSSTYLNSTNYHDELRKIVSLLQSFISGGSLPEEDEERLSILVQNVTNRLDNISGQ